MNPEPATIEEAPIDFSAVATAMLARREPIAREEYEAYVFKTEIRSTMERWGFEDRFRRTVEQWSGAPQGKAYVRMTGMLRGDGAIVALTGIRGTGKTTMAAQFAISQAWNNYHEGIREDNGTDRRFVVVNYRKATDLISRYKSLYSDSGSIDTERLTSARAFYCREVEFSVIDELHECEDQKLKNRVMADILDRRYAARRDTILISNQTPEEFQASTSDSILSRLAEHGAIIPCKWPSFRKS